MAGVNFTLLILYIAWQQCETHIDAFSIKLLIIEPALSNGR